MTVFIRVNTCFGCSKELYHRDGCFEYTPNIFWLRNRKNNFLLRTLICGNDELPLLTCISRVLFISLGSLGTNSKRSSKNTPKFHLIPAYWEKKPQIYVEKLIQSLKNNQKKGGHLSPGNTVVMLL